MVCLRDIKVNTLEPYLKTLTTRLTLIQQGFAGLNVSFCRGNRETLRERCVMRFGGDRELLRDSS